MMTSGCFEPYFETTKKIETMKQLENIYPEKSNLPKKVTDAVQSVYQPYIPKVKEFIQEVQELELDDIDDFEQQEMARLSRLKGKDLRVSIEKTRKALKDPVLTKGKYLDSIAKQLTAFIVPYEEKLAQFEQAPKVLQEQKESEEREQLVQDRLDQLPKGFKRTEGIDFAGMTDKEFADFKSIAEAEVNSEIEAIRNAFKAIRMNKTSEQALEMIIEGTATDKLNEAYKQQAKKYISKYENTRLKLKESEASEYASLKQAYEDNEGQERQLELFEKHLRHLPLPSYQGTGYDSVIDMIAGQLIQVATMIQEAIETNSKVKKQ